MKKYLFMAVAAIAALSSCSSDNEVFNSEAKKALTFTATMEGIGGDTRATLDNGSAKWEVGDQIYIMGIDASNYMTGAIYVASGTNGTSTTFEPDLQSQEVSGQTFLAYFPTYVIDRNTIGIPIEIEETWAEGKFNMPMFAMSNTTTLAFQNLCGVLAIKVNKDQLEQVKYIEISSSNRKLNGMILPMPNNEGKLSGVALSNPDKNEEYDDLGINYTTAVEIGDEGNVFYVPIPPSYNFDPQTMSFTADPYKDLKIEISDGKGHIKTMTTKKDKEILIERNKIYNITFKDNTPPTTGTAKAKINGVDVEVNWVQLWAGGPKFAEYNIGTTKEKAEGNLMTFYDAIKTGDGYAWGANWRTPSKDEMDQLRAASYGESEAAGAKVTCERVIVGGINGFIFTGKEAGYTGNKVFFPADESDLNKTVTQPVTSHYWTCTYDATVQVLYLASTPGYAAWNSSGKECNDYYVRPVLNEAK